MALPQLKMMCAIARWRHASGDVNMDRHFVGPAALVLVGDSDLIVDTSYDGLLRQRQMVEDLSEVALIRVFLANIQPQIDAKQGADFDIRDVMAFDPRPGVQIAFLLRLACVTTSRWVFLSSRDWKFRYMVVAEIDEGAECGEKDLANYALAISDAATTHFFKPRHAPG